MRLRRMLSEAGKGLGRNLSMTVSVVLVAFVSLLFVGSSALLQQQIGVMKGEWYDKVEVSVFMCPSLSATPRCAQGEATPEQLAATEALLGSETLKPYVESYEMETKAEAYKNFMKAYGEHKIGRNATEDMMPVSFRIKLVDVEKYQVVAEQFSGRDGVDRVVDMRETLEPLVVVINRASWITAGLAVLMGVAAVLLISTTIRLSALSRAKEVRIMRMVGASNLFVQMPFVLEGAIAALVGAAGAIAALWLGVHYIVDRWLADSISFTTAFISAADVVRLAPWLLLAALALATLSSVVSLSKYTKV